MGDETATLLDEQGRRNRERHDADIRERLDRAEQQRDRLLKATQALMEETGLSPYFSSPPARQKRLDALYETAADIEADTKDKGEQ